MSSLKEAIQESENELTAKVEDLKVQFEHYQEEYYKLESLTGAFKATAERLLDENELYKQLYKRTQELINKDDFEQIKRIFSGLDIKL